LYIGTELPIWPEFNQYIIHDLKTFQAKSFLLTEDGNITGHVLLFNENDEILYFGFFGVLNHEKNKIDFLLNSLIEYGKHNKFSKIIGPVNIPTFIYGWGFMEKGSEASIFIGKPINPPIYQEVFFHKGFTLKTKELSFEGPVIKVNSKILKNFNSENYEIYSPESWEEVLSFKPNFYRLKSNLPRESIITPGTQHLYESYVDFVKTYGGLFLIVFLKYKITDDIVGCWFIIPNPFRKNKSDIYDSCEGYIVLLEKEHQGKGLGLLLSLYSAIGVWDNNIRYNSSPIESNLKRSIRLAKKFNQKHKRTHVILEYSI
jgi:hypothetical protein